MQGKISNSWITSCQTKRDYEWSSSGGSNLGSSLWSLSLCVLCARQVMYSAQITWQVMYSAQITWQVMYSAQITWQAMYPSQITWQVTYPSTMHTSISSALTSAVWAGHTNIHAMWHSQLGQYVSCLCKRFMVYIHSHLVTMEWMRQIAIYIHGGDRETGDNGKSNQFKRHCQRC